MKFILNDVEMPSDPVHDSTYECEHTEEAFTFN